MINIVIIKEKDAFEVKSKGHANYDEFGKDIVCSAVSILFQNLCLSLEKLTNCEIKAQIKPGDANLKAKNIDIISKALIDSFEIGIKEIASVYTENVDVITVQA